MDLNGKVALITGAAQGIGKSIALTLARKGADIAVSDVNLEKAEETAKEIQGLGRKAIAIKGNVASVADAEKMVEDTITGLGKIDILVNNPGGTREFASRSVNVNAVAPGFIETAMTAALPEAAREALTKQIPLSRLGSPDDVANAVLFLVSDASSYITGQVINVNGGMYM